MRDRRNSYNLEPFCYSYVTVLTALYYSYVHDRTNSYLLCPLLWVRDRTNSPLLFVRDRTNSPLLVVRDRTNSHWPLPCVLMSKEKSGLGSDNNQVTRRDLPHLHYLIKTAISSSYLLVRHSDWRHSIRRFNICIGSRDFNQLWEDGGKVIRKFDFAVQSFIAVEIFNVFTNNKNSFWIIVWNRIKKTICFYHRVRLLPSKTKVGLYNMICKSFL